MQDAIKNYEDVDSWKTVIFSSAKDLSKCLVMSLRIEFCDFLIVAQSDDFTNN